MKQIREKLRDEDYKKIKPVSRKKKKLLLGMDKKKRKTERNKKEKKNWKN